MAYLYSVSLAYGVGTGVWIDALAKINVPGIAFIPPVIFGAAVADRRVHLGQQLPVRSRRAVGGGDGAASRRHRGDGHQRAAVAAHRQRRPEHVAVLDGHHRDVPDGHGRGRRGFLLRGVVPARSSEPCAHRERGGLGDDGGRHVRIGCRHRRRRLDGRRGRMGLRRLQRRHRWATGAIATFYTPSWQSLRYMWAGEMLGTLATTPVYLFYIGSSATPRHGLIANALGGLAGIAVAAALTGTMKDPAGHGVVDAPVPGRRLASESGSPSGNVVTRGRARRSRYGHVTRGG